MTDSPDHLPLVNLCADDDEIGRYAELLDSLSIGLLVFATDGSLQRRNTQAAALLGDTPASWEDENGQPLAAADRLEMQVLQTGQAIRQRAIGIRSGGSRPAAGPPTWCTASAFPVFAADGSLRQVLLTLADLSRHNWLASETRQLPTHDPLTGVFTERYISLLLDDEGRRARRYGTPFALALIAIDQFQGLCAAHGAAVGERILSGLGRLLAKSLREFDMVGRFGSDQFLLILPNVRVNDAIIGLERLRELIDSSHANDPQGPLTISGGVSEFTGEETAALIERVRSLLAAARDSGCNRLCVNLDFF
ncbi:MAG TPA: hypothetical protein DHV85_18860 [Candidatus Accumulibacter sp.]|uniref:sensor domain-containing diguanylate cyclase n=1 Tax=Accumulibacter sp. TaxID=2053492 RepID=UPI000EB9057C|nr:diguanylate cyclase [Accumulibacter sp.]HCZ16605.1 hypothetical protein [Accumulibacter sp.]HRD93953.1 diguanylate cyclase [Accumulibacter sp.]